MVKVIKYLEFELEIALWLPDSHQEEFDLFL